MLLDDDTNSMNISLTAEPVAISEGAGTTDVTLTATLDGSALAEDATVNVTTDDESTATRDVDYTILLTSLTIPAGAVSGTTTITITPVDDRTVEADETIRLTVPDANNQITAQDDEGGRCHADGRHCGYNAARHRRGRRAFLCCGCFDCRPDVCDWCGDCGFSAGRRHRAVTAS